MEITEYEREAARTGRATGSRDDLLLGAVGLAGEAGEVADIVKKHVFHGHELDRAHALEELGDILWYVAFTAGALGSSLSEVAAGDLRKLERRYPEGQPAGQPRAPRVGSATSARTGSPSGAR